MLIAQCDSRLVLSDVKLVLLEALDPDTPVTVLARLGLPDESVTRVALADLDRDVTPDHLTSLFVDTGTIAVAGEFAALVALTERLRGPGGCPWDAEQTHHSLVRHLLEEAYEVAEAIDGLPAAAPGGDEPIPAGAYDALEDELGDLLFQVVIHSVLAREAGAFTIADVARGIHDKLVRRHPHVFGTVSTSTAATTSCATGSRSSATRRAPARSSRGSRRTFPRCCSCRSCSARPTRSVSTRRPVPSIGRARALGRSRRDAARSERAKSASCSRRSSRSRGSTASTPRRRCASGPGATAITSRRWRSRPRPTASTSLGAPAATVADLWAAART